MNEEGKPQIILECAAGYLFHEENGGLEGKGDGQARLDEENISILPRFGEPLLFPFRDIIDISGSDYRIQLTCVSKEKLTVYNLGYKYEDFLRVISKLRNEILLKDMLMHETLKKSGVEAEIDFVDAGGDKTRSGKGEVRLYETAIVIMPESGELLRVSYSDISEIQDENHVITITTDWREKYVFSGLGRQFEPFTKTLSGLMNELTLKVQSSLRELLPGCDPSVIRKAGRLMKEGKAATRGDIELISPELWTELEKKLAAVGIKEEYDFLGSLGRKEKVCIGLKRGLLGELTGEYIWFLIPSYSLEPEEPGNAVALESVSGEDGGKATYFFRIVGRKEYPGFKNLEDLHRKTDEFIRRMNRCMREINFRREPIYLTDERLDEPQYRKYKFAIRKIPALQELRRSFIGRVIHSSPDQWKKDVLDLLSFNVKSPDDTTRWKKGEVVES